MTLEELEYDISWLCLKERKYGKYVHPYKLPLGQLRFCVCEQAESDSWAKWKRPADKTESHALHMNEFYSETFSGLHNSYADMHKAYRRAKYLYGEMKGDTK